jgi:hypothetical protein
MKTWITSLILALSLQACSDSTGNRTELEGSWESICMTILEASEPSGDTSTSSPPLPPATIANLVPARSVFSFHGNTTDVKINTYSDDNCVTLSSSVPITDSPLVNPGAVGVRFEIGNIVTTSNGVTVKELNLYNADDELMPDIYLIQNSGTTLYFGKKCYPTDRPTEIYYDFYFTRQD